MKLKVLASGSKGNCYLLQSKTETLILECGISYKQILEGLNFDLKRVVGCLITHEHKDHCKAVEKLIENGIDIYSSKGTFQSIGIENHRTKVIESEKFFKVGNFTIMPFEAKHDANEPLGFLINHKEMGNLLFLTDSYYCEYSFNNLNHILIECNYSKNILDKNIENRVIPVSLRNRIVKSHFELENVIEFLESNDLSKMKTLMLLHLSSSNSDENLFIREIAKKTGVVIDVAKANLELYL